MKSGSVILPFAVGLGLLLVLPLLRLEPAAAQTTAGRTTVDLRPRFQQLGLETRPQGVRNTCSVFTMVGAIEFATAAKQGKGAPLSVEFLNWAAHRAARRRADGGFFSDLWRGYERFGICSEQSLPYRTTYDADLLPEIATVRQAQSVRSSGLRLQWIKEWDVSTGLSPTQIEKIKTTLAAGSPVCAGLRWPKQERWDNGVLRMCEPDAVFDGHSILLVGYRDDPAQVGGGVFLIRNSAGPSRDGALPYAYVSTYTNDAAWVE